MLLQQASLDFPFTLDESVMAGRYAHRKPWQAPTPADRRRSAGAGALWSGRARAGRASAVRWRAAPPGDCDALAQDAGVLLLDEPVNHLDLRYQATLMAHFCRLARWSDGW